MSRINRFNEPLKMFARKVILNHPVNIRNKWLLIASKGFKCPGHVFDKVSTNGYAPFDGL